MARVFNRIFFALIAGAAGGAVVSALRSDASRSARPAAKRALRTGVQLYERARQAVAELGETASDLVAEVHAELDDERRAADSSGERGGEQIVPFEARSAAEERKAHG
jgi:soluble lytic murein transglycosylase-like protein